MNEKEWDKRLLDFLKRTGEEIKTETQRLVEEVRDPATQRKVKESLREFGSWAKQTAEEAAQMMESAIKKAETAISQKIERSSTPTHTGTPTGGDAATTSSAAPSARSPTRGPQGQSAKVGKGKRSSAGKGRTGEGSKTIGKKK